MFVVRRITTLAALFGVILCAQAQAWQNLFPSFSGLTFGDNKFVAVSSDGAVMTSDASSAELSQQYFTLNPLYSAAFGGGVFIATHSVSSGIGSIRSLDGINWTPVFGSSSNACKKLTFGNNEFVGTGDGNKIFVYDDDDGEWMEITNSNSLVNVVYGHTTDIGNRYAAVGNAIVSSANAINWSATNISGQNLSLVSFGNGTEPIFVAYGYTGNTVSLFTSSNGTSWTQQPASGIPAGMADMTYGNGKFVAVGAKGATASSSNGTSWTTVQSGSDDDFKAVEYGDGVFMALGVRGSVYTSNDGGASWTSEFKGHFLSYTHIAHGGNLYMAVGDSGAIVSSDGKNWTKKYTNDLKRLTGVAYGNNMFVTVSDLGSIFVSKNNGADDWEMSYNHTSDSLVGVAYDNTGSKFVAVGKSSGTYPAVIYTSNDGLNWSRVEGQIIGWNLQNTSPTSICFGNGKFLAGSTSNGRMFSSANGSLWEAVQPNGLSQRVTSINYANGKFTGTLGTTGGPAAGVLSSNNGTDWEVFSGPPDPVRSVTYANGHYVAVGNEGKIFTSPNGQNWSLKARVTNRNLRTVYSDENNVLAAGESGAMLYSKAQSVSVRYQSSASRTSQGIARMSVDAQKLTLSFSAHKNAKITFYSLNGKTLYTHNLKAGEKNVKLSQRVTRNGVVIAQYAGGGQKFAQRLQFAK